jgi:tetratricopeptide (TPR) repeat protein
VASENPTYKNIIYGSEISAGTIHLGDVHYHLKEDFSHSMLFLHIEKQNDNLYQAQLSLKSNLTTKGSSPLLKEKVVLEIKEELFTRTNDFQNERRKSDQYLRKDGEQLGHQIARSEAELSHLLFESWIVGDIRKVCLDFVGLLRKRKIEELLLVIATSDNAVMNLPFEMMIPHFFYQPLSGKRLNAAPDNFGLVRTSETSLESFDRGNQQLSAPPLKMLFVTALPENMDENQKMLEIEDEQKRLIEAIGRFESTGDQPSIVSEFLDTASLHEIEESIRDHHHDILHISGHGSYNKDNLNGVLYLEDQNGNECQVSGQELGEILQARTSVKLVILSACETAVVGNGIVEAISTAGIPAVIAMRFPITDMGARIFTSELYKHICEGRSLTQAMASAREELVKFHQEIHQGNLGSGYQAEYYTPVLFLNQYFAQAVDLFKDYQLPQNFIPNSDFLKTRNTRLIGSGFIGRKRYLNRLRRYFTAEKPQHVVLHGLGGLGKTTLAEAFSQNFDNRSHEIIIFRGSTEISEKFIIDELFYRFEKAGDANKVRQIRFFLESPNNATDKLQLLISNYLSGRKTIIILDNFEDLQVQEGDANARQMRSVEMAEFVHYLCQNAPQHCHILITTRYAVPDLNDIAVHLALDKMTYAESYRLTNFSKILRVLPFTEKQEIFWRLDGHPRAYEFLEILLRNQRDMSWTEISKQVDQVEVRIWEDLLLEKIYNLLPADVQALALRMSICFTRTSTAALAAIMEQEEESLLPLIEQLHLWSLCYWDAETQLFEMHRLTREWLDRSYVMLADRIVWAGRAGFFYKRQNTFENGELALQYFEIAEDWDEFTKVSFSLERYLQIVGMYKRALELNQNVIFILNSDRNIFKALFNQSNILFYLGRIQEAKKKIKSALQLIDKNEFNEGKGAALNSLAQIYQHEGNFLEAFKILKEVIKEVRETEDKDAESIVLNNLGQIYFLKGSFKQAEEYSKRSLLVLEGRENALTKAAVFSNLAIIYSQNGEYEKAKIHLEKALNLNRELGNRRGEATTLNNLSEIYHKLRDYDRALEHVEGSLSIALEIGDIQGQGVALNNLGMYWSIKKRSDLAMAFFCQALGKSIDSEDCTSIAEASHNCGVELFTIENNELALKYLLLAHGIQLEIGIPGLNITQSYLERIRFKIGEQQFNELIEDFYKSQELNSKN